MKHYSLEELKQRIQAEIAADPDAVPVRDIVVSAPEDPEDLAFMVGVMLLVNDADNIDLAVGRKMLDDVRRAFGPDDERVAIINIVEAD